MMSMTTTHFIIIGLLIIVLLGGKVTVARNGNNIPKFRMTVEGWQWKPSRKKKKNIQ